MFVLKNRATDQYYLSGALDMRFIKIFCSREDFDYYLIEQGYTEKDFLPFELVEVVLAEVFPK